LPLQFSLDNFGVHATGTAAGSLPQRVMYNVQYPWCFCLKNISQNGEAQDEDS
jgi:hypothetical protein